MSEKLPVLFPRKPKRIQAQDPAVQELQEYVLYMTERLEYMLKLIEKKIAESE